MLFAGYLIHDCDLQSSSVKTYILAIKGVLNENDISLSDDCYLITSLTPACKLKNNRVIHHFPIEKGFLQLMLNETEKIYSKAANNQPYLITLYKAMLVMGYYGLLRVGEITKGPHVIKAHNVHLGVNKNKILFILTSSKTHNQGNEPQLVKISQKQFSKGTGKTPVSRFNPFNIISQYIDARPLAVNKLEQFFVFSDNSPVHPEQLRGHLHKTLINMRIDPLPYNVHSLAVGRCGDLLKLGVSVETIKKIGHWKSNAVFTYLRN